jgi:HAD superfamily hydrolase (TIGR01490 family)
LTSVAFFDLDLTLVGLNTATAWLKQEVGEGRVSKRQAAKGMTTIALYQLGFSRVEDALLAAIQTLEGQDEAELAARSARFWDAEVQHRLRPGARAALDAHRAAGDHLAVLTSSSIYLGELAARRFGLDVALGTRFEVQGGRFTGRPDGGLCYGAGKLRAAEALARARGVPLGDCAFYTDSLADLPVLEAVGRPHVVHPDPRLKRVARARGWPVLRW